MTLEIVTRQLPENWMNNSEALQDLDFIVTLGFELFKTLADARTTSEYAEEVIIPHLNDPDSYYLVALNDGTPAGYCILRKITEEYDKEDYTTCLSILRVPLLFEEPSFCLTDIGVKPEERGNGVGKELMIHALKHIKALGGKQVYATCWKGELGQSLSLCRTLGFVELVSQTYDNGDHGVVVMKNLDDQT